MDATLRLMALEPLPSAPWKDRVGAALQSAGLVHVLLGDSVLAWTEQRTHRNLSFAEALRLERLWLGPRRWALAVTARRIYFQADGDALDLRQEHLIVGAVRPAGSTADRLIEAQHRLLGALTDQLGDTGLAVVQLRAVDPLPASVREVRVGTERDDPPMTFNALYRSVGFDRVPVDWTVTVCPLDGTPTEAAEEVAGLFRRAAEQRKAGLRARVVSVDDVEKHIESMRISGAAPARSTTLLFLLPHKGKPPSPVARRILGDLDRCGVRYRRAYADDPWAFSVPDQLPSLLLAAGGRPHRVEVAAAGRLLWSVGVDLAHDGVRRRSTLAVALVDPQGALVDSWVVRHPLNEAAHPQALAGLLGRCTQLLASLRSSGEGVLVLRDGRLFEGETDRTYRGSLGPDVSLYEYRKGGNPQVVTGTDPARPVAAPAAAVVDDESTMFLVPAPPIGGHLPAVARVTWRGPWNGLGLSPAEAAGALVALTVSPGLGIHPRSVPAPIYWADGIAGADDEDLRFRGNGAVSVLGGESEVG